MPNWCQNTTSIVGPVADLEAFRSQMQLANNKMSFCEAFIPMPKEMQNTTSPLHDKDLSASFVDKYGAADWYEWCNKNWGSKWGDCETFVDFVVQDSGLNSLVIEYQTAWGPVLEALNTISTLFPKCIFYTFYEEHGMGFRGFHKVKNGEVRSDMVADLIPSYEDLNFLLDGEDEQLIESD